MKQTAIGRDIPMEIPRNYLDRSSKYVQVRKLIDKIGGRQLTQILTLIESYLSECMQRVILNGKSSRWSRVTAGVPQGSVLGHLFFLVYINDLVDNISADVRLFADDTSLFTIVYDGSVAADQGSGNNI